MFNELLIYGTVLILSYYYKVSLTTSEGFKIPTVLMAGLFGGGSSNYRPAVREPVQASFAPVKQESAEGITNTEEEDTKKTKEVKGGNGLMSSILNKVRQNSSNSKVGK